MVVMYRSTVMNSTIRDILIAAWTILGGLLGLLFLLFLVVFGPEGLDLLLLDLNAG